jgi:hypothetical protein
MNSPWCFPVTILYACLRSYIFDLFSSATCNIYVLSITVNNHVSHVHVVQSWSLSRLGGVVVSVLATGLKDYWFEPGQGDGFLRATKIRSTPSCRLGSKAGRSHVVRFYGMWKNSWSPTEMNRQSSHFLLAHLLILQRSLVVKLALADLARSLGHIRFPPGIVQQATGRSAETKSRPIATINVHGHSAFPVLTKTE